MVITFAKVVKVTPPLVTGVTVSVSTFLVGCLHFTYRRSTLFLLCNMETGIQTPVVMGNLRVGFT